LYQELSEKNIVGESRDNGLPTKRVGGIL